MDPLSIAGLTIASLDALIRLGERIAELISDIRTFDDETRKFRSIIIDETLRTRLLRGLLFSECAVYGNSTLFEQFDGDIQNQVDLLLTELKSILHQACELLERHYGNKQYQSTTSSLTNLSIASTLTPSNVVSKPDLTSRRSFSGLLMWSLRDKKRTETILRSFADRNDRLHEKVKLWCLASQLGVRSDHLLHLKDDETSKKLGFDKDAALKLSQSESQANATTLELIDPSWDNHIAIVKTNSFTDALRTFEKDGVAYLQENHPCASADDMRSAGANGSLDLRTRNRVDALARLLHQPKERIFRIPPCVGWRYLPQENMVTFIFEIKPTLIGSPKTLLQLLQDPVNRPELGDKFRLATELARCVSQLHLVRWVHESFRSDNVLMFPTKPSAHEDTKIAIDFTEPCVLGFMFSRPEPFFSAGKADWDPTREIYRHPERQGQPAEMFRKIHDIYSLGVVLLEIGLWEPAISLEKHMFAKAKDSWAIQAQLLKHAQKRLDSRLGRRYKEIVIKCLTGNFGIQDDDTREELALQQAFRTQVVDVLENSANAL